MAKIFASGTTLALLLMLVLAGAANAAERRTDRLRPSDPAASTELSSADYYYGHRHHYYAHRTYGHPYYSHLRTWGPYQGYYPYAGYSGYPYWGYPYWGCSLCGGYRPWFWAYPIASVGFGSGPRWWW